MTSKTLEIKISENSSKVSRLLKNFVDGNKVVIRKLYKLNQTIFLKKISNLQQDQKLNSMGLIFQNSNIIKFL